MILNDGISHALYCFFSKIAAADDRGAAWN